MPELDDDTLATWRAFLNAHAQRHAQDQRRAERRRPAGPLLVRPALGALPAARPQPAGERARARDRPQPAGDEPLRRPAGRRRLRAARARPGRPARAAGRAHRGGHRRCCGACGRSTPRASRPTSPRTSAGRRSGSARSSKGSPSRRTSTADQSAASAARSSAPSSHEPAATFAATCSGLIAPAITETTPGCDARRRERELEQRVPARGRERLERLDPVVRRHRSGAPAGRPCACPAAAPGRAGTCP